MKFTWKHSSLLTLLLFGIFACSDPAEENPEQVVLRLSNVAQIGPFYDYGFWLVDGDQFELLGRFDLNSAGGLTRSIYNVDADAVAVADGMLISIESVGTEPTEPSVHRFLAGDLDRTDARLSLAHPDGLGVDFEGASLGYTIATPTDPSMTDEPYGLWFYDEMLQTSTLNLPPLPEQWQYQAWMATADTLFSMGSFTDPTMRDDLDQYGGGSIGYDAPGEDFIQGQSSLPFDVRDGAFFITVEPVPDIDEDPFGIRLFQFRTADTIATGPTEVEFDARFVIRGIVNGQ